MRRWVCITYSQVLKSLNASVVAVTHEYFVFGSHGYPTR